MTTQDLKQRTFEFGIRTIRAVGALPRSETAKAIGRQLLPAGTSVGANYRAAARARSRADFVAKLGIVEEECDEASYWMVVMEDHTLVKPRRVANHQTEASELLAIVVASIKTARRGGRNQ